MGFFDYFKSRTSSDDGMIAAVKSLITPIVRHGSQKTYDTQAAKVAISPWYGVRQPYDLALMRKLYLGNFLARRIVNSLVRLTLSDIVPCSENEDLDLRVLQYNRSILLKEKLSRCLAQYYCFGACYSEIVIDSPNPRDVLHICDSRSMRVDLDPYGTIRAFLQLPQTIGIVDHSGEPIRVEPEAVLHAVFSPLGDEIYGTPILWPIQKELKSIALVETAMVKAAIRATIGQDLLSYQAAENEDQDEVENMVDLMVEQIDDSEPGAPLVTAGAGEWKRQGPASQNPTKMTSEWEAIIQAAISGADLTPDACGLGFSSSLHEAAEMRHILLALVESVQAQIVEQLNSKLYSRLADIWNTDEITVEMKSPILLSEKERAEKETICINNVGLKEKMGVIKGHQVAQELGYDDLADESQNQKWMAGPINPEEQVNPGDPNTSQQLSKSLKDIAPQTKNTNQENSNE